MLVDSTLNHLVSYLYKETSTLETFEIEDVLENDEESMTAFLQLQKAYRQLPLAKFSPKLSSVQAILRYSKRNTVEPSN